MNRPFGFAAIKFKAFLFLLLFLIFTSIPGIFVTGCSNWLPGDEDTEIQGFTDMPATTILKDGSGVIRPVVFVHFSDSHFGLATGQGIPLTISLLKDVVPRINPLAVIHTGDLVDQGYESGSWDSYRAATGGQIYPKYVDIPGNHDVKVSGGNDGRKFLKINSVTGRAEENFYGITRLGGTIPVCLMRTNTAASPTNNNLENINGFYTSEQNDFIFGRLAASPPAAFNVLLAHHPIAARPGNESVILKKGADLMSELITKTNAPIYLCGHVHEPALLWFGKTLVAQADDFGKNGLPSSFFLIAYDLFTGPAAKLIKVNAANSPIVDWPIVFITSPADSELGGINPRAKSYPSGGADPKLQVMIYSAEANAPMTVECRIGEGETALWKALEYKTGNLWESTIPVGKLMPGVNKVRVRAIQGGNTAVESISIKIN
jgi:hypothetical protein